MCAPPSSRSELGGKHTVLTDVFLNIIVAFTILNNALDMKHCPALEASTPKRHGWHLNAVLIPRLDSTLSHHQALFPLL
jgi:hypothetical protein